MNTLTKQVNFESNEPLFLSMGLGSAESQDWDVDLSYVPGNDFRIIVSATHKETGERKVSHFLTNIPELISRTIEPKEDKIWVGYTERKFSIVQQFVAKSETEMLKKIAREMDIFSEGFDTISRHECQNFNDFLLTNLDLHVEECEGNETYSYDWVTL